MHQRPYKQVDVFTATPYFGNPLAVVLDASGLDDAAMQRFACWTNLSETTFLLPPTQPAADYRVRIFTPGGELPFAGHPTLGSCHAWLQSGGKPKNDEFIVQECPQGLVKIRRENGQPNANSPAQLLFAAPALKRSTPSADMLARVAAALGITATQIVAAQLLDNGPIWLGLLLDNPQTLLQLAPEHAELKKINIKVGAAALYGASFTSPLIGRMNRESKAFSQNAQQVLHAPHAQHAALSPDIEVRAFAASIGIHEDPVTGSLNASLAQWFMADGIMPVRYTAYQGACLGRAGEVTLARDTAGQVWVGGQCVSCIDGSVVI